jgi:hypothetical protein
MTWPGSDEKVRPSGWWIVLSVVLFVLALGGCSTLVAVGAVRAFDVDTLLSREGTIGLEAGDYTVYLSDPNATVTITAPDGSQVDLDDYDGDTTVTSNDVEYEATYTFHAPVDGRYSVIRDGEGSVAIGEGIGRQLGLIGGGLAIGFIGAIAAFVIFIITLVKRSTSRNHIRARQYAAAGWPNAAPGDRPPPPPPPPPPR